MPNSATPGKFVVKLAAASVMLAALAPSLACQGRAKPRSGPRDLAAAPTETRLQLPRMVIDGDSNTVRLSMGNGMELIDFIKWVGNVTGKRFTLNPHELRGVAAGSHVHFFGKFTFDCERFQQEFFEFFQTMLYIKGFAIIPRGEGNLELLEIVLMNGTRGREVSNSARYVAPQNLKDYQHQSGVPILTTVQLEHINAQLANNALRPFFASAGGNPGRSLTIGSVGSQSALLLQGFGPQVYAAVQLLNLVDQPSKQEAQQQGGQPQAKPEDRVMHVVVLEHADPTKIEHMLNGTHEEEAEAPAAENSDGEKISFSMKNPEGMELIDFVKWAQQATGKRFTFNLQELTGGGGYKVHLLGTLEVERERCQEEFFSFFQTMLYTKGFAIIPRGAGEQEMLEIVMMSGMRGREVANGARYVAPEKLGRYRYQAGVPILTTIKLKNINAQIANNALRPFFASTGSSNAGGAVQIGNVGNRSSLLLQGFGPQVFAAAQLIKLVDKPSGRSGLIAKSMSQNGQDAIVISGTEAQVHKALELVARLDVAGSKAGKSKGSGSTKFGQATFHDTDDDGLPDTRLPSFGQPRKGAAAGKKNRKPRSKGKSRIF